MNVLKDFQQIVFDKLKISNEHVSLLEMPCGCGKGEIYCHYATLFDKIVIVSPLKQHVEQNIKRLQKYLPDYKIITFDSDYYSNMSNINILDIICSNTKCVIGITYCAYERSIVSFSNMKDLKSLIICDEVHNITKHEDIYRVLFNNFSKVLLASATPNKLNLKFLENKETDIYYLSVGEAIERKNITDYNIYLPLLKDIDDKDNEDNLENTIYDTGFESKVEFMKNTIEKSKCKKIVVYLSSISECDEFIEYCKSNINEDYWYETISCHVDIQERRTILHDFQNNKNAVSILCSIHILDECIDIPKCDGVFLVKINHDAEIKIVQRVFRSMRLDSENPEKKASIMLWCDDIDTTCTVLNILKEKDNRYCFNDKIKIVNTDESSDNDGGSMKAKVLLYLETMSYNENQIWNEKFIKLCEISSELDKLQPRNYVHKNTKIGDWVHCQKMLYGKNMLPSNRLKTLLSNSFFKEWTHMYKIKSIEKETSNNMRDQKEQTMNNLPSYNSYEYFYEMFKIFDKECSKLGSLIVYNHIVNGISIGSWLNTQKMKFKNDLLSAKQKALMLSNIHFKNWSDTYKLNNPKKDYFKEYEKYKEALKSCNDDFEKMWNDFPNINKILKIWKGKIKLNKLSEDLSELLWRDTTLTKYFNNEIIIENCTYTCRRNTLPIQFVSTKKRKYEETENPIETQTTKNEKISNYNQPLMTITPEEVRKDFKDKHNKAVRKWFSNPENRAKHREKNKMLQKTPYAYALKAINSYRKLNQDPTPYMIEKYKLIKSEDGSWKTLLPKITTEIVMKEK